MLYFSDQKVLHDMVYITLCRFFSVDCRAVCHPDCKDRVPLPCVPCTETPGSGKRAPVRTCLDVYFSLPHWLKATEKVLSNHESSETAV